MLKKKGIQTSLPGEDKECPGHFSLSLLAKGEARSTGTGYSPNFSQLTPEETNPSARSSGARAEPATQWRRWAATPTDAPQRDSRLR